MIPDFQSIMLPLLRLIGDGKAHSKSEAIQAISKHFNLSEKELTELIPNSKTGKKVFNNRLHWAKAHLTMAGLIEYVGKDSFRITETGKNFIAENPKNLNIQYLKQKFPDYKLKQARAGKKENEETEINPDNFISTPDEVIDSYYIKIRQSLEQEILSKLKAVHPSKFETIVVQLLVKMGYGGSLEEAGKATRYTNDEGIDGIIKEDKLGLDVIYVQAKRWEGTISRPEIQKFVGALAGQRAKKGVFITTSDFSKEAIIYASQMDTKIVLINGETLAQYMIDHNLGVSVQNTYEIKKVDSDYFEEE